MENPRKQYSTMNTRHIITLLTLSTALYALQSCSDQSGDYDAMGTFEATEVVVSAKAQGELTRFDVSEGATVSAGDTLGWIDVAILDLQQQSMAEGRDAQTARVLDLKEQTASLEQQISHLQQEHARFSSLLARGAATQQQVDDLASQVKVLQRQLAATRSQLRSANESIARQASATDRQMDIVRRQKSDAVITSPIDGTILLTYAEQGEYAVPGKALFKVADLRRMVLRAYVTADQYDTLHLGQQVKVMVDNGDGTQREYDGRVTWIAQQAEFTPKTIQTRDERANLVYAIKVSVKNDGKIKIGQYGECYLNK